MSSGSWSIDEVCNLKSGTSFSGIASGICDCEDTFLGLGNGAADVDVGEKFLGSKVGEALAELDAEEDIAEPVCVAGDAGGDIDLDLEFAVCR